MANITIHELRPAGSELFQDSESFLNELTDREMSVVAGGGKKVKIKIGFIVVIGDDLNVEKTVGITNKYGC